MTAAHPTTRAGTTLSQPGLGWSFTHPLVVDAVALVASVLAAGLAWRPSFDSFRYLVMIGLATAVGFGCARLGIWIARRGSGVGLLAAPVAVLAAATAYLLLSPAAVLGQPFAFGRMAPVPVTGWKDLLSTLPPVDVHSPLGGIPLVVGLLAGVAGALLADRVPVWAPALVPLSVLAAAAFLGTPDRSWALPAAAVTAACTAAWGGLRRRRTRRIAGTGGSRTTQAAVAAALLTAATAGAALAVPHLPGVESRPRVLARTIVDPPFDVSELVSPLAGFRRYGSGLRQLWDQDLLSVSGAEPGQRLRFAVLDTYTGSVWSAGTDTMSGGVFHRIGSSVAEPEAVSGAPQSVSVTIEAAYAAVPELSPWVPGTGLPTRVRFTGPQGETAAANVRLNPATGQLIVPSRLAAGTRIDLTAYPVREVPKGGIEPDPAATIDQAAGAFLAPWAAEWAGEATRPWNRLAAIGKQLVKTGAFSDGTRRGEEQYWPGHGQGRLLRLLSEAQPVGSDEQYAAAFALLAQQNGIPARVVMGAVVEDPRRVRGRDVHAWIEVRAATGEWFAVPNALFMPGRSKLPKRTDFEDARPADQAIVPGPIGRRPPGSVDSLIDGVPPVQRPKPSGATSAENGLGPPEVQIPRWVDRVGSYAAPPLAALAGAALLVTGLRGWRRRRRRTHGDASRRLAAGWRDLTDHARDLGVTVDARHTRVEQSGVIGHRELATRADRAVFGAGEPAATEIDSYWDAIAKARKALSRKAPRRARLLRPWQLRSLLARD